MKVYIKNRLGLLFKGGFIKHWILGLVKLLTRGHVGTHGDLSVRNHVNLQDFPGRGHAGGLGTRIHVN